MLEELIMTPRIRFHETLTAQNLLYTLYVL